MCAHNCCVLFVCCFACCFHVVVSCMLFNATLLAVQKQPRVNLYPLFLALAFCDEKGQPITERTSTTTSTSTTSTTSTSTATTASTATSTTSTSTTQNIQFRYEGFAKTNTFHDVI